MSSYIIKNTCIVNEGVRIEGDIFIKNDRIEKIGGVINRNEKVVEIDGSNKFLLPGVIDDQVHFREPGLTYKASIHSESRAAVAGGVTSFMEMPNTIPPTLSQDLLEEKYAIGASDSLANFSFYMGTSGDNYEELMKTNAKKNTVCGIKIFMGSSTGNMLVDNPIVLDKIFGASELLIATHCEDESIILDNLKRIQSEKANLEASDHPIIKNEEACFESSFKAIQLAIKHDTRLHILHISTEKELQLFSNMRELSDKRITAEVCVHHLHFTSDDYARLGNQIKCNPAIKAGHNREALWKALLDDRLDVIATDHAPHSWEEKNVAYSKAHAGLPLVQHSLMLMLRYVEEGRISLEKVVEKMSHAVATCFQIEGRGFIREGYFADLVLIDRTKSYLVGKDNLLFKCGWSPLEGAVLPTSVTHCFVNGGLAFEEGKIHEGVRGKRLTFLR